MDFTLDSRLRKLEIAFEELQDAVKDLQTQVLGPQPGQERVPDAPPDATGPGLQAWKVPTPEQFEPSPQGEMPGLDGPADFGSPPAQEQVPQAPIDLAALWEPVPEGTSRIYKVHANPIYYLDLAPGDIPPSPDAEKRALSEVLSPWQNGEAPQRQTLISTLRHSEFWLNKVGIVLFLCGVAFLFKYAIDKQWIDEPARLGAGVLMGSILVGLGLRLHATRRHFSQVLVGGAIATYYITGYAAYNIFPDLHIPYEVVFAFMGAATVLAFVVSLWGDDSILSLIGVAGGMLTPFVLDNEVHLPFLMMYTCLLLAGTSAIYLFRGWRSLLWTSLVGGWVILAVGWWTWFIEPVEGDPTYLQLAAATMLATFWLVPVVHEVLNHGNPTRYRTPPIDPSWKDLHLYLLTAFVPFATLGYSTAVWAPESVSSKTWGWVALGGAIVVALMGWLVRRANGRLAYLHILVTIGLLNLGLMLILEGNGLLLALALEATALHLISFRYKDQGMEAVATIIFGAVGIWMLARLTPGVEQQSPALINPRALTDLVVLGLAFGSSFFVKQPEVRLAYRGFVHVAALGWLWREIHDFPNGQGYVMLAWAAYGIGLHLAARRLDSDSPDAKGTVIAAHLAFDGALGLLAYRLATGYVGTPFLNEKAAIDLMVMGMALVTSFLVEGKRTAAVYRLVAHAAVLAWLWREAEYSDFTNGYVMLRWAAYSAVVAAISYRLRDRITLMAASAPFAMVAALFALRIAIIPGGNPPFVNRDTLIDLCTLALALAVSFVAQPREVALALRLAFHAGILALLWRELSPLQDGQYYVLFAWAAYAGLLYLVTHYRDDALRRWAAHVLAGIVGGWMLGRIAIGLIFHNPNATPLFNVQGMSELGVMLLAVVIYWIVRRDRYVALAYGLWLHLVLLGWVWQELGLFPDGNGYVTVAWGVYALALIGASLKLGRNRTLMVCGTSTLFIIAAKLFLIDLYLYHIETVWRILLFLGFGGLFLLVSYFFQNVIRRSEE